MSGAATSGCIAACKMRTLSATAFCFRRILVFKSIEASPRSVFKPTSSALAWLTAGDSGICCSCKPFAVSAVLFGVVAAVMFGAAAAVAFGATATGATTAAVCAGAGVVPAANAAAASRAALTFSFIASNLIGLTGLVTTNESTSID